MRDRRQAFDTKTIVLTILLIALTPFPEVAEGQTELPRRTQVKPLRIKSLREALSNMVQGGRQLTPEEIDLVIVLLQEDPVRYSGDFVNIGRAGTRAEAAVPLLAKLLEHPDPTVRVYAAQSLVSFGPLAKNYIQNLIHYVESDDLAACIIPDLVCIQEKAAFPWLLRVLKSGGTEKARAAGEQLALFPESFRSEQDSITRTARFIIKPFKTEISSREPFSLLMGCIAHGEIQVDGMTYQDIGMHHFLHMRDLQIVVKVPSGRTHRLGLQAVDEYFSSLSSKERSCGLHTLTAEGMDGHQWTQNDAPDFAVEGTYYLHLEGTFRFPEYVHRITPEPFSPIHFTSNPISFVVSSRFATMKEKTEGMGHVTISGRVNKPGIVRLTPDGLHLVEAISLAGGFDTRAFDQILLQRKASDGTLAGTRLSYSKILLGKMDDGKPQTEDPLLQDGDILFVYEATR